MKCLGHSGIWGPDAAEIFSHIIHTRLLTSRFTFYKSFTNSLYIRSVAKKPSFLLDLILAARKPAICIFWMYHILQPTHPPRSLSQDKMMLGYSHLSGILSGNLPSSTNSLLRFPQSPVCFKTLSLSYFFNPGNNIR